jgi:tetratricopeptide (TPR) repeat protein
MSECPNCQAPCEPDDRFCSQCGERLSEPEFEEKEGLTQKSLSLAQVHYNLGMVYYKKGEYRKALQCWEKGLQQDPANTFLQKCIAELKEKLQTGG